MKFNIFLILSLIFYSNSGLSQTNFLNAKPLSEWQKQKLQDRAKYRARLGVKERTTYNIEINKRGKIKSKRKLTFRKTYNKNGVVLLQEQFFPDLIIKTNFYYNKRNKKTESKSYHNGVLESFYKFDYDINGKLRQTSYYSGDGELKKTIAEKTYREKPKNRVQLDTLSVTYYSHLLDLKNYMEYKKTYSVDSLNVSITDKYQSKKNKLIYDYNTQNYTKKDISYNPDGTQRHYTITEYDSNGLETKFYIYSKNGTLERLNEYKYNFYE